MAFFSHEFCFLFCMASTDRKYSLNIFICMLVCSREAWLHGKQKDSCGNMPSLEVPFSNLYSQNNLYFFEKNDHLCKSPAIYGNLNDRINERQEERMFSYFFIKSCILERVKKGGKAIQKLLC